MNRRADGPRHRLRDRLRDRLRHGRRLGPAAPVLVVLLLGLVLAGCGGTDATATADDPVPTTRAPGPAADEPSAAASRSTSPAPPATSGAEPPARERELTVLAAASLTEGFTALAAVFEAHHPDVRVRLSFDSSATLAEQVVQGAPADVLATADIATMQRVTDAGAADDAPEIFATNTLVLAVPQGNPAGIDAFADLDDPGVAYVACVPTAPCGAIAASALEANGVTARPRSLEVDVKAVLSKVLLGEADAGLVYATDAAAAADDVDALPVPHAEELTNDYPVAVVTGTEHPDLAYEWIDLLVSEQGSAVLRRAGFGLP